MPFFAAALALAAFSGDVGALRREAMDLAAEGKLDAALALVEGAAAMASSPALQTLRGRLDLRGDAAQSALEAAAADTAAGDSTRGESLLLLGQLHAAAGRPHLAIPRFREYLSQYPAGGWAEPARLWMARACLALASQPRRAAYLDTGLKYLSALGERPPATAQVLKSRLMLAAKNPAAAAVLTKARRDAPPEEAPAILLLLSQADRGAARAWEDSLRAAHPRSLENRFAEKSGRKASSAPAVQAEAAVPAADEATPAPAESAAASPSSAEPRFALQLGAFSRRANAEQMMKRLAARDLDARIEEAGSQGKPMFRVLFGAFATADSARREGEIRLKPLGYLFQVTPLGP